MRSYLHLPRLVPAIGIVVACLCATAGSASAAGCTPSYNGQTRILTIDTCWSDPDAPTIARISRTAGGAIQLDGQAIAGGPTVTNTDRIVYHGEDGNGDDITLDMSNGQFAPGHNLEVNGSKMEIEIEIDGGLGGGNFLTILGQDGPDLERIAVGAGGIDVNGDNDSDITRTNIDGRLTVDGQAGPDHLSGTGFLGYGQSTAPLALRGGPGSDDIFGAAGSDELSGGAGEDSVSERGSGSVTLTDTTFTGAATDTLSGFESASVYGSSGPDTIDASGFPGPVDLAGSGGSDTLIGGLYDDWFRGDAGDDTIHGGPGIDFVNQAEGAATLTDSYLLYAEGTDNLDSIEAAFLGGSSSDDRIDAAGFSGSAELRGYNGADVLIAPPGGGTLLGGEDADELVGGPGPDIFKAGAGDDRITSRDALTEPVDCGDGADTALADALDTLAACEQIDRGDGTPQPGDPGAPAGPSAPGADAVAPALSRLALSRRAFRAARSGAALAASVGTTVRLTLSEPAKVTFRIKRKVGRRHVLLRGKLVRAGAAGRNRLVFRGRLGRRALPAGRYRLVAHATDAAGNRSAPKRADFRILAR